MTLSRMALTGAVVAALSACGGPSVRPDTPGQASAIQADSAPAIEAALMRGDVKEARRLIKAATKRGPLSPHVQLLRDSIDRDPVELLGPQSYGYTVRAGDTIAGVAERLLGNRWKAYQLARYNGLEAPFALAAGRTLRIPGTPRAEPVRRADPAPARASPATAAPAPARPAAARPAPPASNPALARQLRTAGLAALNQGAVARAVALLRRAAAADRGNAAIARDLARAERIAATVRARR